MAGTDGAYDAAKAHNGGQLSIIFVQCKHTSRRLLNPGSGDQIRFRSPYERVNAARWKMSVSSSTGRRPIGDVGG